MADEIELKLSLPVAQQRLLLRQPILQTAVGRHARQLINIYYDTPDLTLHRHGIALRLRKQGNLWLQTVKCAGVSAAGLTSRPEWEMPYAGHFDFSSIDDESVRRRLENPRLRNRIVPLFETSFRRTTWRFEPAPDSILLLMFDRGWITANNRRETISELEIELAGPPNPVSIEALFNLARTLGNRLALVPETRSKAERGYRIFQGDTLTPQKARIASILPTDTPTAAFRKIAFECLEHLQGNHPGAVASDNPEFIHQMRVAARRLRAAFRTFAPGLPQQLAVDLLPPLRTLTGLLGHARDFDVLHAEIVAPVMHALPDEPRLAALTGVAANRRHVAHAEAVRYLKSAAYGQLLLQATAQLHCLIPPLEEDAATPIGLSNFAGRRLKRLRKKLQMLAARCDMDDPASLHQVRITAKRLRYALEFLAPLAAPGPRQALQTLLKQLARLQNELGQMNDLSNAGLLLMNCAGNDPELREAVALIGGWHIDRYRSLQGRLRHRLKKISPIRLPRLG